MVDVVLDAARQRRRTGEAARAQRQQRLVRKAARARDGEGRLQGALNPESVERAFCGATSQVPSSPIMRSTWTGDMPWFCCSRFWNVVAPIALVNSMLTAWSAMKAFMATFIAPPPKPKKLDEPDSLGAFFAALAAASAAAWATSFWTAVSISVMAC